MSVWRAVVWDTARAGGMTAYVLITISIVLGLALSMHWYSKSWPRWATTELHRYLTLLALVFTGIHTLAVWLDPYMAFGPGEVLIPLASHYRPFWVALGIVAAYLMIAIWLSDSIQKQIGYRWWRRLHYATIGIYALATVHGIGTGTDTRTAWALALYGGSAALIMGMLALRLLAPGKARVPHPRVAGAVAVAVLLVAGWTVAGPLRPGWGAAASSVVPVLASSGSHGGSTNQAGGIAVPFSASLSGQVNEQSDASGNTTIDMSAGLSRGAGGNLHVVIRGQSSPDGSIQVQNSRVVFSPGGRATSCSGAIVSAGDGQMIATCDAGQQEHLQLDIELQGGSGNRVSGTIQGQSA